MLSPQTMRPITVPKNGSVWALLWRMMLKQLTARKGASWCPLLGLALWTSFMVGGWSSCSHVLMADTTASSTPLLEFLSNNRGNKNRTPQCRYVPGKSAEATSDDLDCLLDYGASPYIETLTKTLVGHPLGGSYDPSHKPSFKGGGWGDPPLPFDPDKRLVGADIPPQGYTMIGNARMENLRCAIESINREGVEGDIVELGVWRGGAMMLASAVGKEAEHVRNIHLFDTFGQEDRYGRQQSNNMGDPLPATIQQVKSYFEYFGLDGPYIHFEVGWFRDTLPKWKAKPNKIAILRIDASNYEAYQDAFFYLYDKVPVGGIVIMDGYSIFNPGVERFWKHFSTEHRLVEKPVNIDGSSAWFQKELKIHTDWRYYRPPQDLLMLPPKLMLQQQLHESPNHQGFGTKVAEKHSKLSPNAGATVDHKSGAGSIRGVREGNKEEPPKNKIPKPNLETTKTTGGESSLSNTTTNKKVNTSSTVKKKTSKPAPAKKPPLKNKARRPAKKKPPPAKEKTKVKIYSSKDLEQLGVV